MKNIKILFLAVLAGSLFSCSNSEKADGYGNFEATEITISSEANGKLEFLNLEEGQVLEKGDSRRACRYPSALFEQTTTACFKGNSCFKIGRRLVASKCFEPTVANCKNGTTTHPKYVYRKRCHPTPIGPSQ